MDDCDVYTPTKGRASFFGALHGVIHAAGVTKGSSLYRPFHEFTTKDLKTQFAPKALGVAVLEAVLDPTLLDFILLVSSNAAVFGGLGYCAYAAANAFMDAFAEKRQGPWLSVDWDPWPLETKTHSAHRTATDQYAMSKEEALRAFDMVINSSLAGNLVVVTGDLEHRLRTWTEDNLNIEMIQHSRPILKTEYVPPSTDLQISLAAIWMELLGVDQVGVNDNFFDLGGHSLLAIRLVGLLRDRLSIDVPAAVLFGGPTIAALSGYIAGDTFEVDHVKASALEILGNLQ